MTKKEIPRWLSRNFMFPFLSYRWVMEASLRSCGITSYCHKIRNCSVSFCVRTGPPTSNILAGKESDPCALPFERESIAFRTSDSFGGSAAELLIST